MPTLLDRLRSIWSLKPHRELSSLIAHYNLQGCSPEYQCLGAPSPSFLGRSLGLSILKGPQPFQQKPRLRASAPHSLSQFHFFVPPASPSTHNLCLSPLSSPSHLFLLSLSKSDSSAKLWVSSSPITWGDQTHTHTPKMIIILRMRDFPGG